jgi:hypothetical protein
VPIKNGKTPDFFLDPAGRHCFDASLRRILALRPTEDIQKHSENLRQSYKTELSDFPGFERIFQASLSYADFRRSRKRDAHTVFAVSEAQNACGAVEVNTLYKKKADKVRPLDTALRDGSMPDGNPNWREDILQEQRRSLNPSRVPGAFDHLFEPRYWKKPRGCRITPERWEKMVINEGIWPAEKELLKAMVYNREKALAWDFTEIGRCDEQVVPAQVIRTVEHKAWQAKSFPIPKGLRSEVVSMLQERIDANILERSHGPYRNPWFLVEKKDKKHRLINSATNINAVTVRDAMLPPNVDEFSEHVAGRPVCTLLDFLSGYDQITLHPASRDLTAIQTPLGLLRQTTLLQGATNSVAQFVRAVMHILHPHLAERASPFVDDIVVNSPRTSNTTELAMPGVRKHILLHLQWIDGVLADIERSGCTVSGKKSHFCAPALEVVGYLCGYDGRRPTEGHVKVIQLWPACDNITQVRGFLGACTYYRIWIENFSNMAAPLFGLLRKDVDFVWEEEQQEAMQLLKNALTTAPALMPLDYSPTAGKVILAVDSSVTGFGGVLMQLNENNKRRPCRYESGLWTPAERKYDIVKLECRSLLHMLRKCRPWLYGIRFTVETDANTLVAQLNRTATDLPGALVTRWLAWIRLWDFDVKHVPGKQNVVADALSRIPWDDDFANERQNDLDAFVDHELSHIHLRSIQGQEDRVLVDEYSDKSQNYARWLTTLRRPEDMSMKEFSAFKKEAMKYLVREGHLFRRQSKNSPLRRVVDDAEIRQRILQELHDESGHRGREGTYRRVADRFYWAGLFKDVEKYVSTCFACQTRAHGRTDEALHPTWSSYIGEKWSIDVVHMPLCLGHPYMALAREDLSGWVEGTAMKENTSKNIADFVFRDVICRHGMPLRMVSDGGPENKAVTDELLSRYGIKHTWTSAYHPQGNGMIERGHPPIVNALAKYTFDTGKPWVPALPAMLWADRTTVKATTGMTPARVMYGAEHILPIEVDVRSWKTVSWQNIVSTEDLLTARCAQLDRRDEALEEVLLRVRRQREANKEPYDDAHRVRNEELAVGDIVLLWDSRREVNKSSAVKLHPRWLGPYRITAVTSLFGSYRLAELDGSNLTGTFAGKRLKLLHMRNANGEPVIPEPHTTAAPLPIPRVLRSEQAQGELGDGRPPMVVIPQPDTALLDLPVTRDDMDEIIEYRDMSDMSEESL